MWPHLLWDKNYAPVLARIYVWWPGITTDIEKAVRQYYLFIYYLVID